MKSTLFFLGSILLLSSCTVIRPGEIGIKQRLGKLNTEVVTQGSIVYNPIVSKVIKASSQTKNIELSLSCFRPKRLIIVPIIANTVITFSIPIALSPSPALLMILSINLMLGSQY